MKSRSLWLSALALASLCAIPPARAEEPAAAPAVKTAPVAIEPRALALLKDMSETLAKASSISFHVRRAFDEPAANGQPLVYYIASEVTLQRPDKLKIVTLGDGPVSEFYYDGKEILLFLPEANLVAVDTAPPKLDDMLEAAYDKAGLYFPFVDFIVADPYAAIAEGLTSAFVIGRSQVVGGVETDIVAIATKNIQAQIWIGSADRLPRLVWLNPTGTLDKPRSVIEFSNWKLGAPLAADSFRSEAAAKAGKIKFAKPAGVKAPAKP
ncbi:DUF2092 domain-containing protein [uncultured Rhodoblastus sp.]|uniref:DUF2092 domain-containing protein n=1 Tax=uncultured Rhodoblastus sp. TaxID=543037 RepID=UPI0025F7CACA|nr:DUF2092 domain-containing protein [uncultured Rhodoblastus sp.]